MNWKYAFYRPCIRIPEALAVSLLWVWFSINSMSFLESPHKKKLICFLNYQIRKRVWCGREWLTEQLVAGFFRNYVYVNSMSGRVQTFSRDTPDLIRNKKKSGVFELPPSQIVDTSWVSVYQFLVIAIEGICFCFDF